MKRALGNCFDGLIVGWSLRSFFSLRRLLFLEGERKISPVECGEMSN